MPRPTARPSRAAIPLPSQAAPHKLAWGNCGLLAALLVCACQAIAQPSPPASVEAVGDAIVFDGQINARSASAFLRLLQDPKISRLIIRSGGGMVTAALDMAAALHARQLDVEVPESCRSSCANYIFPAARRKLVRPGAVAWHGNMTHVMYLHRTGQGIWNEEQIEGARQLAAREADFYRRVGVDGFIAWFAKLPPYNVDDFYWLSVDDMKRFGLGDVTERATASVEPDSGELRSVQVDWPGLEASRPAVLLGN